MDITAQIEELKIAIEKRQIQLAESDPAIQRWTGRMEGLQMQLEEDADDTAADTDAAAE